MSTGILKALAIVGQAIDRVARDVAARDANPVHLHQVVYSTYAGHLVGEVVDEAAFARRRNRRRGGKLA